MSRRRLRKRRHRASSGQITWYDLNWAIHNPWPNLCQLAAQHQRKIDRALGYLASKVLDPYPNGTWSSPLWIQSPPNWPTLPKLYAHPDDISRLRTKLGSQYQAALDSMIATHDLVTDEYCPKGEMYGRKELTDGTK
jgi:hypothetical protein